MTTKKFCLYAFALFGAAIMLFSSCEKEEEKNAPLLTTIEVTDITQTTATTGGNITDDGGATVTARGVCWSTSQNPTISDNKTEDGTVAGSFTSNISGLEPNTMYYVRAYATNSEGTGYGSQVSFETTGSTIIYGNGVTDIDDNEYITVIIGGQEWMAENLKTTKYNNGTPIPNITNNTEWAGLSTGAYAWYNNDEATYKDAYGALYNWFAVETGNLCPTGWHVPTDAEWYAMENYIDPTINDPNTSGWRGTDGGTKLKTTNGWNSDGNGTNVFGFSALPDGERNGNNGNFYYVGDLGTWWNFNEEDATNAWYRSMFYDKGGVYSSIYFKRNGFSVRCLRDN